MLTIMESMMNHEDNLIMLCYTSIASHLMTHQELLMLLKQAREQNLKRKTTGILIYMEGCFFQILEGERNSLEALYVKIASDKRHHHVIKLLESRIDKRNFAGWNMAFRNISREELAQETGLTDFLDQENQGFKGLQSESINALIDAFRQGRWQTRNTRQHKYMHLV